MDFVDVIPPDTIPETSDVEYPCKVCGKEAGPYGGRGRKPVYCTECKKPASKSRAAKVTGAPASLASQATAVLVQLNGMMALGMMAMGFNESASALAGANSSFEEQAYMALVTDQDLCKLILKGGVKSAKVSLAIAYGGLAVSVFPTAVNEFKDKKAVRDAAREVEDDAART
jgi:hypothetical protein